MNYSEKLRELRRAIDDAGPFSWEQTYELDDGVHWALSSPKSAAEGRVADLYSILEATYTDTMYGRKVSDEPMPKLFAFAANHAPALADALDAKERRIATLTELLKLARNNLHNLGYLEAECSFSDRISGEKHAVEKKKEIHEKIDAALKEPPHAEESRSDE
jgi:hypothetical protein